MSAQEARPDYVTCVGHEHVDLQGTSWCGRDIRMEFAFVNPSHAAENGRQGGYLVACPACGAAIVRALNAGADDLTERPARQDAELVARLFMERRVYAFDETRWAVLRRPTSPGDDEGTWPDGYTRSIVTLDEALAIARRQDYAAPAEAGGAEGEGRDNA